MTRDTVAVIIATFGEWAIWGPKAEEARKSAAAQTVPPDKIILMHEDTLAKARNRGAEVAGDDIEWLIFLDADDTLDPGYVEAMLKGSGDLRQPATLGVTNGIEDPFPVLIPSKPLWQGNYLVIGTMVRREQFLRVGGFWEWPAWEDWCLFRRCVADGAVVGAVPDAVYRVTVNPGGRNESAANNMDLFRKMDDAHRKWLGERQ